MLTKRCTENYNNIPSDPCKKRFALMKGAAGLQQREPLGVNPQARVTSGRQRGSNPGELDSKYYEEKCLHHSAELASATVLAIQSLQAAVSEQ